MRRFLLVAFGLAWPLQLAVAFELVPAVLEIPLLGLAGIAPTLAALACTRRALAPLRGPWPVAWLVGAALAPTALVALAQLLTATTPALAMPFLGAVLLPPLGEEPGWRGVLTSQLRARRGPLMAAIIVSALWALWHLPTAFYPGASLAGFPPYALGVFCAGIVMAWLVERTGSLPVAVAAHAGLNGVFVVHGTGAARVVYVGLLAVVAGAAAWRLACSGPGRGTGQGQGHVHGNGTGNGFGG